MIYFLITQKWKMLLKRFHGFKQRKMTLFRSKDRLYDRGFARNVET